MSYAEDKEFIDANKRSCNFLLHTIRESHSKPVVDFLEQSAGALDRAQKLVEEYHRRNLGLQQEIMRLQREIQRKNV